MSDRESPHIGAEQLIGPEANPLSPELLAQHLAGRVGEAINLAFTSAPEALERLDAVLAEVGDVVSAHGLHRSLDDYIDSPDVDLDTQREAYLSGTFHGIAAVTRSVAQELTKEDRLQPGSHRLVAQKCQDLANSLMLLDFNASVSIAVQPPEPVDGVEPCVLNSYMAGVKVSLERIVGTVRNRVQRRVVAMLDTDVRSAEQDRLSTLLFIALTNYSKGRLLSALGEDLARVAEREKEAGNVVGLAAGPNPPLGLTESGSLVARKLLEHEAA